MATLVRAMTASIALAAALACLLQAATPLGTGFTYQGQLGSGGQPVNGTVDLQFTLFDDLAGGAAIGTQTLAGVAVNGGLFTVTLNAGAEFGAGAFNSDARWLQIAVRSPHDPTGTAPFTTLLPRQPVTPAPVALYALNAPGTGGATHWDANGSHIHNTNSGNVGIGELTPAHPLHVTAQIQTAAGRFVNVNAAGTSAGIQAETSSSLGRAVYGIANVGSASAVYGETSSSSGQALFARASSATGTTYGVRTSVTSPDGYSGYFVGGRNYFGGNVGMGALDPEARLDARGTVMSQLASGNNDNFVLKKTGTPAPSNVKFTLSHRSNGSEAWMYTSDGSGFRNLQSWDHANNRVRFPANGSHLVVDMASGRVGIGTAAPEYALHAVGTGADEYTAVVFGHNTSSVNFRPGGTFQTNSNVGAGVFGSATATTGAPSGVLGTSAATFGRGVTGTASASSGTNYGIRGQTNSSDGYAGYFVGGRNYFEGNVGIGTTEPQAALHVNGTTRTSVITITGGSDLAESFEVRSRDAGTKIQPGMVVVIDPDHPGQLMLSTRAYDKRVAGIISGAGGLNPGMVMRAEGNALADGGHQVALTGRVWCWCDASTTQIEPGDMLTSSDTPGHAMRKEPGADAHGAVLGKAMTPLASKEKGLVLVLVTLQ